MRGRKLVHVQGKKAAAALLAAVLILQAYPLQTEAAFSTGASSTAEEADDRKQEDTIPSDPETGAVPEESGTSAARTDSRAESGEEKESPGTGAITVRTDDAESIVSRDRVCYNKEITVEFSVDQEGNYTASYLKDGRTVRNETHVDSPYTAVLRDSGTEGDPHPVYDTFEIMEEDGAESPLLLSPKPDRAIVIDTRGPVIDCIINRKTPGIFSFFQDRSTCSVFADDRNGAGTDPDQYAYYIGSETESLEEVRGRSEDRWTGIPCKDGEYSFALTDMSGVIWLRVKDLLGNVSYRRAGALVQEQMEPVIRVKITDPDQKEIYACSSQEAEGAGEKGVSEYYRTLNVRVSVSELPSRAGTQGYSGISRVSWALVPPGTDAASAQKSREYLTVNDEPSDLDELYGEEQYQSCTGAIDPRKLVEKIAAKEKGYELSGSYLLYIWAADFCGNGEACPLMIPVLLDVSAPAVTVQMDGGTQYRGKYYYRAEQEGDSAGGSTAAVTIRASDDRSEGSVRNLTAVLKGTETTEELTKRAGSTDPEKIVFTAEDLKKQFGETEQEITITVSASDGTGNETVLITKEGTRGIQLESDGKGGWRSGSFVRDAVSPRVTIQYASAGKEEVQIYGKDRGDSVSGDSGLFLAYTCGEAAVTYEVEEAYAGEDRLFWSIPGAVPSGGAIKSGSRTRIALAVSPGEEKTFACTAYGTDAAGNPAIIEECFAESTDVKLHPESLAVQETYAAAGCRERGDHSPVFRLVIDRKPPEITLTYSIDQSLPPAGTAYVYEEQEHAGNVLTAYLNGVLTAKAVVEEAAGEREEDLSLLYFANPGEKALAWDRTAVRHVSAEGGRKESCISLAPAEREGRYLYRVYGTDRAGNRANVTECFEKGTRLEKMYTAERDLSGKREGVDEKEQPYYAIVIDTTAPAYSLSINQPSNLQETFDPVTGITYYGKSVSSIQARFLVTEQNFDGERILAGIASASAAGEKRMDKLSPGWSAPDVKGKSSRRDGLTTAVFSLQIEVDKQHEGIYRFEIAGCDKAGNALVPSPAQAEADRSDRLRDAAAGTVPCRNLKGGFWTRRKAVDVTAPTGVLKVTNTPGGSSAYCEMRFEQGGNIPVRYEPFRPEKQACLFIRTRDSSPTAVSFNLRSEDGKKDAAFRKSNPVTAAGQCSYAYDNSIKWTVKGEQVFYLEDLVIKDRAGNIRVNDPDSGCTLAKSGNIYLDAEKPVVSAIRDAESPQVRITAAGSFTRHEGDGDRYIYRPDGSALDLKVAVSDPGGKAHSSGLKDVEVEVRVGDRLVTDKVELQNLPYTYEKGSRTGHNPLRYEISQALIRIPAGSFAESNDITVTVRARDNSGNSSCPAKDGGLLKLGIDTTAPRVEVNYLDTVEPRHGKYFRAGRTAEIVVIDRNVSNEKIRIETNTSVPSSFTAPHVHKEHDGKGESGNGDRWSKMIRYDADGDYTLQISGSDALGNRISGIKWKGPAPQAFTVDKTRPVIRILLPGEVNERDGIKYYDAPMKAVIEIREHNFLEETDTGLLRIETSASNHSGAEAPPLPRRPAFQNSGPDLYTSAIAFARDGDYEIRASYTDMAGNEAAAEGGGSRRSQSGAWSGRFTVDTAAPEVRLDPETFRVDSSSGLPLEGMENQIYTDRDFAPRVMIRDTNYDEAGSDFTVEKFGAGQSQKEILRREGDESRGEYSIQFRNFEMEREMDGVYRVRVKAVDLAGHRCDLEFRFSVNRFGSTWVCADQATGSRLQAYYINDTSEPLRILELSPVELRTHQAEVFKDHVRRTLSEGLQYTFEAAGGKAGESRRDSSGHWAYVYTIAPEVYEEEGIYDFILSSTDFAGNKNTTALFRDGTVKGEELCRVKFPIELQVDKTVPVSRITGVVKEEEQFNTDRLKLTVYPEDYQTDLRDVKVRIWKGARKGQAAPAAPEKELYYRKIGREEDTGMLAAEHIYPIEDAKKGIPVTLEDDDSWQLLEVIATDLAGNESTDLRTGDPGRNLPDTRRRFLVTTNPLVHLTGCRPVFYGIPAAVLLLYALYALKKGRREAESKEET